MSRSIRVVLMFSLLAGALAFTGCKKKTAEKAEEKAEKTKEEEKAEEEAKAAAEKKKAEEKEKAAEEAAGGQWVESDLYGVKFRVPENWKVVKDEQSITVNDPEGTTTIVLVGSESENVINTALKDIKDQVQMKELEIGKSDMTVINGLAGYKGSGSAVLVQEEGDQEIQFLAYSLKVNDRAVTMLVFAEAEMYEAKKEEIEGIAKTIKKTS